MARRIGTYIGRHHVALLALFFGLAGTSYAASSALLPKNSVGSKQVRNGSLQAVDLSKKAKAAFKGARGMQGLQGVQGQRGPTGAQGTRGSQGIQGLPGTARAYGRVAADGTLTRSKNVSAVTSPSPGVFCIALAGIDASQTGLVATPDYRDGDTFFSANGRQTIVEWALDALSCPAGHLQVDTGRRVISTSGSGDGDVRTVANERFGEPFFFVVP